MRPRAFTYVAPGSMAEAVAALRQHGTDAKVLAGGQSLVPLMKLRLASPKHLVDITRIPRLDDIRVDGDYLTIGTLVTHDTIETSPLVRDGCPVLAEAAGHIADPIVRNRGTIGGNLCHADPAGDFPSVIVTLGAELTVEGSQGKRTVAADAFFVDLMTTALGPDEVLTAVRIPRLPSCTGGAHIKLSRRVNGLAIVSATALITLGDGDTCREVKVCLGNMGPRPLRALAVEQALQGGRLNAEAIQGAARRAGEGAAPPSDIHGSAAYRLEVAQVLTERVLKLAYRRAGGQL